MQEVYNALRQDPDLKVFTDENSKQSEVWLHFCLDADSDGNVEYDFPNHGSNPALSAEEMLYRFVSMISKAHPTIMRAMWS